jgi:peroxiredoxin
MCVYLGLQSFRSSQWQYVIVDRANGQGPDRRERALCPRPHRRPARHGQVHLLDHPGQVQLRGAGSPQPRPDQSRQHDRDEPIEQYWAKELAFGRTPEGKIYKQWRFGSEFAINKDGTFQIDDLPPGKFQAQVRCFEDNNEVNFMEDIASVELHFEVPPGLQRSRRRRRRSQSTSAAPRPRFCRACARAIARRRTLRSRTIDGQTWRYADHRGKPLVLVFWGTYSNTDRIKEFGDFARKWGKDPRLSILGCFSARDVAEAKQFIADAKLDFPQTDDLSLMGKFGSSWPEAVVVSADGIIMQKHLHDRVLEKYVNKALAGTTTAASAPAPR